MTLRLFLRSLSKLTESQSNLMKKGLPKKLKQPNIKNIILISSAKGGVGKSTVAANLSLSLSNITSNKSIGLLDLDVFGPNQPNIFNLENVKPELDENDKIIPLTNYGIKLMSMGFLIDPGSALVWRGLMVMQAVERLLTQVKWGSLDCLVIDLPPGTGDVVLSVCQRLEITAAILVTTPQKLALADVERGLKMFQLMKIDVIGYIENMAYFKCPNCAEKHLIFGPSVSSNLTSEKGSKFSEVASLNCLGQLPLDTKLSLTSDDGAPLLALDKDSPISQTYNQIAESIWNKISVKNIDSNYNS